MTRPYPTKAELLAARYLQERVERRLFLARVRHYARLPTVRDVRVVLQQEPEHHVDARIRPRDRVRLRQVTRLLRPGDAEEPVGWIRLVAVLGDPQVLRAPERRELGEQGVDVPEL